MNKTYSNKALPAGTVLREWRLEEVLGVGGFGIVYKGRGIYFNELVAIKEYFPSSISERQEGDTVVPIDSQAEEVHALGLKKFVEEAKLLWNLSKPTRHPNIVSVRSLFEIHGTAYMVMDFEDGMSLSKLLREGKRFNEASLLALIKPIAEGLERAHRVGVLHRDIKPPNILINEDGRPVLIDFGSARFESGDATSTKVTFHTPPYAAIEQYVRTYVQGPWTDIYAMGVVLYECVTGEKPPEVLERMHGGLGQPLADGEWPGFSRTFLRAVDAAMIIRPTERPQSISDWLALFTNPDAKFPTASAPDDADDPTRFVPFQDLPEKIVPVAPTPPDFEDLAEIATPVPDTTSGVEFKRAGQDTNAGKTQATEAQFLATAKLAAEAEKPLEAAKPVEAAKPAEPAKPVKGQPEAKAAADAGKAKAPPTIDRGLAAVTPKPKGKGLAIGGGIAVAALAAIGAGAYFAGMIPTKPAAVPETATVAPLGQNRPMPAPTESIVAVPVASGEFAQALQSLAASARQVGAPPAVSAQLAAASDRLAGMQAELPNLTGPALDLRNQEIGALAKSASAVFAAAIGRDADARTQKLARDLPWADPRRADAARRESAQRQRIAQQLRQARNTMLSVASSANASADPGQAIGYARQALQASRGYLALFAGAYASKADAPAAQASSASSQAAPTPTPTPTPTETQEVAAAGVSPAKLQKFNTTVSAAREIAANVIRLGRAAKPRSNAPQEEQDSYRTLQQGKSSAEGYLTYLNNLSNSMRRAKSNREADLFISQAEQTKRYLEVMQSRSAAAAL